MQITIHAPGSRGDVQPYIALGKGLKDAGYAVRVLTTDDFQALTEEAGLAFCSIGENLQDRLQSDEWRGVTESGNFLKILAKMREASAEQAAIFARTIPALIEGSDLVIAGLGGVLGSFSVAEMLHIPILPVFYVPFTPTRAFTAPLVPALPAALNKASFHITRQMFWQTQKTSDVIARRELGLPKPPFWGPFRALDEQRIPTLFGYSPSVLPHPADWPDHITVTGYYFLDAAEDWTPPADLLTFLDAGDPPVYIGFGSMSSKNPEEAGRIALDALARSGQRGIIAAGWGGLSQTDLPDSVFMIDHMPHSWLFPRMAAVVHHGGAGTTAAGLRAGGPSIVVPFMGDQPFWGRRVFELGVGPKPIPRKRLTADRLAAAISQAVSDTTMQQKAAELGERIRAEDGIGQAVAVVHRLMDS
jgi:sterol 3beta-glucosyltransferase